MYSFQENVPGMKGFVKATHGLAPPPHPYVSLSDLQRPAPPPQPVRAFVDLTEESTPPPEDLVSTREPAGEIIDLTTERQTSAAPRQNTPLSEFRQYMWLKNRPSCSEKNLQIMRGLAMQMGLDLDEYQRHLEAKFVKKEATPPPSPKKARKRRARAPRAPATVAAEELEKELEVESPPAFSEEDIADLEDALAEEEVTPNVVEDMEVSAAQFEDEDVLMEEAPEEMVEESEVGVAELEDGLMSDDENEAADDNEDDDGNDEEEEEQEEDEDDEMLVDTVDEESEISEEE